MYIGGTDERALNSCVFELIANAIEEHLAGRGSSITVTIHDDGSLSVKDDGGGISVAEDPKSKLPFVELALTTLYARHDHLKHRYPVLGLAGVGAKCVNAVSEWMRVNTVRDGNEYLIAFARGRVTEPLKRIPESRTTRGTSVWFKPDAEIFRNINFDRNFLAVRLDQLAALHPTLEFWLMDERPNRANRPLVSLFQYPNGIADFLKASCSAGSLRGQFPIAIDGETRGIKISLGFQFTEDGNTSLLSFVNSSPTQLGGTHVQGFLQGLADAFNEAARPNPSFSVKDVRPGLNAFIGVWLAEPRYGGATKDELINPEVEEVVRELTVAGVKRSAAVSSDGIRWLAESLEEERNGTA
jgi:DNA gyrase subunit B